MVQFTVGFLIGGLAGFIAFAMFAMAGDTDTEISDTAKEDDINASHK